MYVTCLVFVLTLAVVQCTDLPCSPSCRSNHTCQWTCIKSTSLIGNANITVCKATNDTCGNSTVGDGRCTPTCVSTTVVGTCGSSTCGATETCGWKCKKSGGFVSGADVSKCSASVTSCDTSGTCVKACQQKPGSGGSGSKTGNSNTGSGKQNSTALKSGTGSLRHGLSPLILTCGILTKLFLSA